MREQWTVSDLTGKLSEQRLMEYNNKLMCPERPFGTAASTYTLPPTKEKKQRKKTK